MAVTKVTSLDPVGSDGPGGKSEVDDTTYHTFMVNSTKHLFNAPANKYKDLKDVLGLTDVDTDDTKKESGIKYAQGYGYIRMKVKVKGGGSLSVVCDPDNVGSALKGGKGKTIYGKDIDRIYIPRKRVLI